MNINYLRNIKLSNIIHIILDENEINELYIAYPMLKVFVEIVKNIETIDIDHIDINYNILHTHQSNISTQYELHIVNIYLLKECIDVSIFDTSIWLDAPIYGSYANSPSIGVYDFNDPNFIIKVQEAIKNYFIKLSNQYSINQNKCAVTSI